MNEQLRLESWRGEAARARVNLMCPGVEGVEGIRLYQRFQSFTFAATELANRRVRGVSLEDVIGRFRTNAQHAVDCIESGKHESPTSIIRWEVMAEVYAACADELDCPCPGCGSIEYDMSPFFYNGVCERCDKLGVQIMNGHIHLAPRLFPPIPDWDWAEEHWERIQQYQKSQPDE